MDPRMLALTFCTRVKLGDNAQDLVSARGSAEWYQMSRVVLSLLFNTVACKGMYRLVFLGHLNLPSSQKLHVICCGLYPQFYEILFNKKTIDFFR